MYAETVVRLYKVIAVIKSLPAIINLSEFIQLNDRLVGQCHSISQDRNNNICFWNKKEAIIVMNVTKTNIYITASVDKKNELHSILHMYLY